MLDDVTKNGAPGAPGQLVKRHSVSPSGVFSVSYYSHIRANSLKYDCSGAVGCSRLRPVWSRAAFLERAAPGAMQDAIHSTKRGAEMETQASVAIHPVLVSKTGALICVSRSCARAIAGRICAHARAVHLRRKFASSCVITRPLDPASKTTLLAERMSCRHEQKIRTYTPCLAACTRLRQLSTGAASATKYAGLNLRNSNTRRLQSSGASRGDDKYVGDGGGLRDLPERLPYLEPPPPPPPPPPPEDPAAAEDFVLDWQSEVTTLAANLRCAFSVPHAGSPSRLPERRCRCRDTHWDCGLRP